MKNLPSVTITLSSETINIDTKGEIYCFVLFWSLKMTQNNKFVDWCCFGNKE